MVKVGCGGKGRKKPYDRTHNPASENVADGGREKRSDSSGTWGSGEKKVIGAKGQCHSVIVAKERTRKRSAEGVAPTKKDLR